MSWPTLSLDKGSRYETYEDADTATTFELEGSVSSGTPSVHVERDPESLIGGGAKYATHVIGEIVDFFDDIADEVDVPLHRDEPLPGLEVLATTPDGRRVGIDPDTGERYEEIEGATISGTRKRRILSIPGDEEVTVTVSATRLRERLEERGIVPPAEIPYRRTTIVDNDPTIRDQDGVPFIEGRTRQRVETTTGTESDTALLPGTVVEVDPDRINVSSEGQFVTAKLAFEADVDLESFLVESVSLDQVRAVYGDYGFVDDPIMNDEDADVQVKFDRQEVIDAYGAGEHDVVVTGVIDGTTFQAATTIELFEPGNSGGGPRIRKLHFK